MLRWTRRKLRLIRYYSADREQTTWMRMADGALVLSLVLALPATWLADDTVTRTRQTYGVVGTLRRTSNIQGELRAYVAGGTEEPLRDFGIPANERWATYMIELDQIFRGFPLETSIVTLEPTTDLREYGTARKMPEVETGPGSEVREALVEALSRTDLEDSREILSMWEHGEVRHEHNWLAWVASTILWWVSLFVVLSLMVFFARLGSILLHRGRGARWEALVSQGRCPYCGYDLRGLEFSERCPECGELQE